MNAPKISVTDLIAAGFKQAGNWHLDSDSSLSFEGHLSADPGVYVLLVDDAICYVGSAQRGLSRRFRRYTNSLNRGPVATRIRGLIADALKDQAKVTAQLSSNPMEGPAD